MSVPAVVKTKLHNVVDQYLKDVEEYEDDSVQESLDLDSRVRDFATWLDHKRNDPDSYSAGYWEMT